MCPAHLRPVLSLTLAVDEAKDLAPAVRQVFEAERPTLVGSGALAAFNDVFAAANKDSISHRVAAAEATLLLDAGKKDAVVAMLGNGAGQGSLDDFIALHQLLVSLGDATGAQRLKDQLHKERFPYATYFAPPEALNKPKEEPKEDD